MDYFMHHALKKKQEPVKTVLQIIKYLERQAWMLEQVASNADKLPDGLTLRAKQIQHLGPKAEKIKRFCQNAIDQTAWKTNSSFRRFSEKALELSADVCISAHFLHIRMGYELLWRIDEGNLTQNQAIMLDEIAYDLKTVHNKRYPNGVASVSLIG